ncbi:hypothetical protein V2J64_05070 [Staphylococcus saccharolyticus]|nr:hypothetical protein [Staphylococcus saccharolyticus]
MMIDVINYCLNQFPYYDFIATHTIQIGILSVILSLISLYLYFGLKQFFKVKTFD